MSIFADTKKAIIKSSRRLRIIILLILVALSFFARQIFIGTGKGKMSYETAAAEKGTLVTSISGSGTITSGNSTNITTKVSGTVNKVYVTNGDNVAKGQKIADVALDDYAKERQTAAWVTYLEATEAVKEAEKAKVTTEIEVWKAREAVLNAQENINLVSDTAGNDNEKAIAQKTLEESNASVELWELKYKNADSDIANAKAKVASALRNYQENSATIVAPSAGVISDLALAEGIVVSANAVTSNTSGATIVSTQTVGKVSIPGGQLIASVNLSEIDVISVKANQKVTLTLDAYSGKTFTGKVLAVNTNGSVSSGVTSYPVTILLDPMPVDIYPNMGVDAEIIVSIKTDVVLIPSTAIQTSNGQSTVQIMKDNAITPVTVEVGLANDSQTEILSGVSEGDVVVTSTTVSGGASQGQSSTTSPFSGVGRSDTSPAEGPPGGFELR